MRKPPRVVWLPTNDNKPAEELEGTVWNIVPNLTVTGATPIVNVEQGIVLDVPRDPSVESLSDVENSGYRLRRIVGKIFVIGDTLDDASGIQAIGVTAGLIVRRVDSLGTSLAAQVGIDQSECNPSLHINEMDPWIWRRSWLLLNPVLFTAAAGPELDIPAPWNNIQCGSALDGPHVDQKTARVVGPEERLFLDVSVTALIGADGVSEIPNDTLCFYEFRILGSMKTSSGNRRNASR